MREEIHRACFASLRDDHGRHCHHEGLEIVWGKCLLRDDLRDGGILLVDGLRDEGIPLGDVRVRSRRDGTFLSWVYLHGETFLSWDGLRGVIPLSWDGLRGVIFLSEDGLRDVTCLSWVVLRDDDLVWVGREVHRQRVDVVV